MELHFHYHVHKSLPQVPTLRQMKTVSTPHTQLLEYIFYYHLTYALVISFLYVSQLKFASILHTSIHATCHAHLNHLDLIILICSKEYKF